MLRSSGGNGAVTRWIDRIHGGFNRQFEDFRSNYILLLRHLLSARRSFIAGFLIFCLLSCGLFALLGRNLFPEIDSGQIKLHLRAPTGT